MAERTWTRVTKTERCPICGKGDYCCRSGTLVLCMRVESDKPSACRLGGWLHSAGDAPVMVSLPKKEKPIIDWGLLAQTMFSAPTAAEERWYLAKTLGLKESALIELEVGRGWDDYRHLPYSSWPERDALGKVVGIVRRYRSGAKKTMQHSSHGLYYSMNWNGPVNVVVCPEGGSDVAAILGIGLYAIGRPSNLGGVKMLASKIAQVGPKRIIVLGERDDKPERRGQQPSCPRDCKGCAWCAPGRFGMRETSHRLRAILRTQVIERLPGDGMKDAREWLASHVGATAGLFLSKLQGE